MQELAEGDETAPEKTAELEGTIVAQRSARAERGPQAGGRAHGAIRQRGGTREAARHLRQESAVLAKVFESLEGAVARESAREAALTADKAGAEATVEQTKAEHRAAVVARGGGGARGAAGR